MGAISPPPSSWMSEDNKSCTPVNRMAQQIRPRTFPNILYDILNNAESMEYSDIVSFLPHGRAFIICDSANFEELVIPRFFGHKSLKSFGE